MTMLDRLRSVFAQKQAAPTGMAALRAKKEGGGGGGGGGGGRAHDRDAGKALTSIQTQANRGAKLVAVVLLAGALMSLVQSSRYGDEARKKQEKQRPAYIPDENAEPIALPRNVRDRWRG